MRKPCCDKEGTKNGAWSKQEDEKLSSYIQTHGEGCWRSLPKAAGLQRCGKSCRLRWINYLRPDIKHGNFDQDEEDLIIKLHALLGNRWSLIAGRLPGRTDNEVKNYWNSQIRKKLISLGIDPNNHRLNQIIPRPERHPHQPDRDRDRDQDQQHLSSSAATNLSGSMETACNNITQPKAITSLKLDNHKVQLSSDGASRIENKSPPPSDHQYSLINLDLTIAFPSPPVPADDQKPYRGMEFKAMREVESSESFPTLPLFT